MPHDLWPTIKSSLSASLKFGGHTRRTQFWVWIGTLYIVTNFAAMIALRFGLGAQSEWLRLDEAINYAPTVWFALEIMSKAWPNALAVTSFPLGYISINLSSTPQFFPLMLLTNLLTIAPVAWRARDAGYSPFWTIVLLYWSVIGTAAIFGVGMASGVLFGLGAWANFLINLANLGLAQQAVSIVAALAAIFILIAPSKSGPNFQEAQP